MKKTCLILILALFGFRAACQTTSAPDSLKARPWAAAAYTLTLDGLVWAYDRFIEKSEFAKISFSTMGSNLETGFVWDSDRIATNHLGHPYNGGLYFMGARSCGLNFWQSIPYAVGGSLLWELFAEKEPPGLNDMIATPLAGAAFGEVFYRTANLIRDDSTTGLERVGREVAACIFNPVSFVDRLLTGNLWKVNPSAGLYHDRNRFPVSLSLTLGDRYMSDGGDLSVGGHYPTLKIGLSYGDAFDTAENAPFSYFKGSTYMHLGSSNTQPLFGHVGITGRLWGMDIDTGSEASEGVFGIFQQYDFYHNRRAKEGEYNSLFNLSETVAAGPGLMFRQRAGKATLTQSLFADFIALGAVENDNLFIIERHYNMGMGFAVKSSTTVDLGPRVHLAFDAKLFYINTRGDYDSRDKDIDPLYTDTPGDHGYSWAFVLAPSLRVDVTKHFGIELSATRLGRNSIYRSFPDTKARTTEFLLGLHYTL